MKIKFKKYKIKQKHRRRPVHEPTGQCGAVPVATCSGTGARVAELSGDRIHHPEARQRRDT